MAMYHFVVYNLFMTITSVLCFIVLLIAWFKIPRWRNLHNYISIQQIGTGALVLCLKDLSEYADLPGALYFYNLKIGQYLFFLTMCWTLCGQVYAYVRLVLSFPGLDMGEDMRWALLFSYGLLAALIGITEGLIPYLYSLEDYSERIAPKLISIAVVTTLNLLLYVNIARAVLSCSNKRARGSRLAGLIGVMILSDLVSALIFIVCVLVAHMQIGPSKGYDISKLIYTNDIVFHTRILVQTVVVMLNRRSRDEFARYIRLRKNRRLNRV